MERAVAPFPIWKIPIAKKAWSLGGQGNAFEVGPKKVLKRGGEDRTSKKGKTSQNCQREYKSLQKQSSIIVVEAPKPCLIMLGGQKKKQLNPETECSKKSRTPTRGPNPPLGPPRERKEQFSLGEGSTWG